MQSFAHSTRVPAASLYVSKPNPMMFGNGPSQPNPNWSAKNWLTSRFHFSFAEHASGKPNFGVLRVLNDDLIQPMRGFGSHPHRNMEICTYVIEGELTHKDCLGTEETIGAGAIQFMSAGSGVTHSEHNNNPTKPLRLIQIWIVPREYGLEPKYGSYVPPEGSRKLNEWRHLIADVRDKDSTAPARINQDCNIFVAKVDSCATLDFEVQAGRQAYIVCIEGNAIVNGGEHKLESQDAAEVRGPGFFRVTSADASTSHFLLLEIKKA